MKLLPTGPTPPRTPRPRPHYPASRAVTYNPDGLPSRIVHDTGSSPLATDFAYDGDGFRVKKVAGNRFTLYAGDSFEKNETGASKFLFANGSRLAKIHSAAGTFFFHQDHLGSTTVVSDASGNAVAGESAEYKPFGGFRAGLDSMVSNYRFTDQEFDPESNLYYYDARYYDPIIGRFVSADTVIPDYTDPQSLNRYSYVKNNPLMYVDPTGHWSVSFDIGGKGWSWDSERVDWGNAGNAALGLIGHGFGMVAGNAMLAVPSPAVTQFFGGLLITRSAYGWGANWHNLTLALTENQEFSIPNTYARFVAETLAPKSLNARAAADVTDLGLDFMTGRSSFRYAYGEPSLQGVRGLRQSYDPISVIFKQPIPKALQINQAIDAGRIAVEDILDIYKKQYKP